MIMQLINYTLFKNHDVHFLVSCFEEYILVYIFSYYLKISFKITLEQFGNYLKENIAIYMGD